MLGPEDKSPTLAWPSIRLSQTLLRLSRKQRPSVLTPCRMWRPVGWHQVSEAKVWHATFLKGIEDKCSLALAEVESCCSTTIREAESNGTSRVHSTQKSHAKDIQHLEVEAIEEEGMDCLTFLTACGAALRASPPKGCGIMVTPYHLLLSNAPTSTLLSIPLGVYPPEWESAPWTPPSTATGPHPGPNGGTTCLTGQGPLPHLRLPPKQSLRSHPVSKQKEEMPLHKALSRSHQEAFNRDSRLMWKAREDYFQANQPHFNNENMLQSDGHLLKYD